MPFVILPTNSASGGYDITNSLRFDRNTNDYLDKTLTTPTNNKIFTWSGWVKRSFITHDYSNIFRTAGTPSTGFRFELTSDIFRFFFNNASDGDLQTTQVFRDVSAWYHIVVAVDTTQATASNRVKIYSNGSQITSFSTSTYPTQNYNPQMNSAISHYIGVSFIGEGYGGYMSDVFFIDGQQLTPSSFGETDEDTGIWKPKKYTGTYGTNGFYLQFKNSASLGTDSSGNGNTFTVNNLTSVDQSTDTPTNNFATLNSLSKGSDITLTNGNTTATRSTASWNSVMSTIGVSKGKWYWEAKVVSLGIINFGVTKTTQDGTTHSSVDAGRVMYSSNGTVYDEGFANSPIATGTTFTTNDIIGLALDCDSGTLKFYKNGTLINTYSNAGLTTNEVTPANGIYNAVGDMNFGNPPYSANSYTDGAGYGNFSYQVPAGFYSLNTKNLAQYG